MLHDTCLLLMLRAPSRGQVKTRLAERLGDDDALALYMAFVEDMLDSLAGCGADIACWITPGHAPGIDLARQWLGPGHTLLPQPDGDLGERLDHAFRWAYAQGYASAAALGSDLPGLTPRLARSVARLARTEPALIGPSPDGGYWTIGFQAAAYAPQAFRDIPWSTPEVYGRTMAVLDALQPAVLPELRDMDTVDDLIELARSRPVGAAGRTMDVIERLGLGREE